MKKIFIIGLPCSGRTTVSNILSYDLDFIYVDSIAWVKTTFRDQKPEESLQQYEESYNDYVINRLKLDADLYCKNIKDLIRSYDEDNAFVIDNLLNPRDFIQLFDYNTDVVIFLNRIDNEVDCKDSQNIAISVIRDYCFWMASLKLLDKNKWLEFNFSIPGDLDNDSIKKMGTHSTIILVKSIQKVISYLKNNLNS